MKSNDEILNKLGSEIVERVYDDAISHFDNLSQGTTKWGTGKEYTEVSQKLNKEDHKLLRKYLKDTIGTSIFAFLGLFEDNPEFKLIYEKDNGQINLVEISEMLKAEATIENGWIDRFSKFAKDDEAK